MTRATVLTPAGVAAVAVIVLEGVPGEAVQLANRAGHRLAWPAPGRFVRARLQVDGRDVDDVLVLGRESGAELHVHGGAAVVAAVLEGLGAEEGAQERPTDSSGLSIVPGLRAARARASRLHGALHELEKVVARGGREDALREAIHGALAHALLALHLEHPPTVRLVGLPNVGKSTLFNALLMEDRALVSPMAGTTRDAVTAVTQMNGVMVVLEDTEGGAEHEIQRPGADLLVHVLQSSDEILLARCPAKALLLRVQGKVDDADGGGPPGVSGKTGYGVEALRARIVAALGITGDARDDVLAPLDSGFRGFLRQVRDSWAASP